MEQQNFRIQVFQILQNLNCQQINFQKTHNYLQIKTTYKMLQEAKTYYLYEDIVKKLYIILNEISTEKLQMQTKIETLQNQIKDKDIKILELEQELMKVGKQDNLKQDYQNQIKINFVQTVNKVHSQQLLVEKNSPQIKKTQLNLSNRINVNKYFLSLFQSRKNLKENMKDSTIIEIDNMMQAKQNNKQIEHMNCKKKNCILSQKQGNENNKTKNKTRAESLYSNQNFTSNLNDINVFRFQTYQNTKKNNRVTQKNFQTNNQLKKDIAESYKENKEIGIKDINRKSQNNLKLMIKYIKPRNTNQFFDRLPFTTA